MRPAIRKDAGAGRPGPGTAAAPQEIAPGVHRLAVGRGVMRSNVYFIRAEGSWALIDAGSAGCGPEIRRTAESLFGRGEAPAAILLTHDHPDHAGAARDLAREWDRPVWVHPDEVPLTAGDISAIRAYANPLDRWLILPLMRLMGRERAGAIVMRSSLGDVARPFDPGAGVPGLPEWQTVHTPGHTPGHVAFFYRAGRVLITGDAVVTINLNSMLSLVRKKSEISGPPWYVTWDRQAAKRSIAALASFEPRVIAGGHGAPVAGPEATRGLRALAERLSSTTV